MKKILLSVACAFFVGITLAQVRLPKIFSDNMVLQRDHQIMVWGWSSPGEKITVQLNKQIKTTKAGKDGKWKLALDTESAGGPYTFSVKGKTNVELSNVLIGDVWVCSGQSNMEWSVRSSNDATKEIAQGTNPLIRHIKVPNTVASQPADDIKGGVWKTCTPENVGEFTAVGYFFARQLTKELNVPIGLINTSWGGTHSETWTSREAFEGSDEFKMMIASMPKLDLEAIGKQKSEELKVRLAKIQGKTDHKPEDIAAWKNTDFNDASWPKMNVPEQWEHQSLGDFDGTVWVRKTFDVAAANAGKAATLSLAMIDDTDETFVNGTKVGEMNQWNEPRKYEVPSGILKAGKNVIAIRIVDTGGGGGMHGAAEDVKIAIGRESIPLNGEWKFQIESIQGFGGSVGPNDYPTLLYNAMLAPLIPYTIKGALWYQGESNAGRAFQYRKAFPLMITDWRKHWGQGDFPFYFVQLASFNSANGTSANGSTWAELREAQTMTLSLPNTGMAVTTDIGESNDIHPKNKQDVGKRLAAVALKNTYGKQVVDRGPTYKSFSVDGNKVIITYDNVGGGLMATDKYGYIKGFEVAGSDQKFHYAKASIQGNNVIVTCDEVSQPVAARYSWADDPADSNLFNKEGFPAEPFRSDTWKGVTEAGKFMIN